jgi:anaerobic magnesium-protoporphyrin IX monomethyl ester cyclase
MTNVALVYPYFRPANDDSIFRFPPLGLGYLAAYLRKHGLSVELVDCTFMKEDEALEKVRRSKPRIIGIYSMFSMKSKALDFARSFRKDCRLLVAGGPLPTSDPESFLKDFDVVVIGEGEETLLELVQCFGLGSDFSKIKGIAFSNAGGVKFTGNRDFVANLDSLPFPSRDLFDNEAYISFYQRSEGYSITSLMSSRGCPFQCDFCSRPVFGNFFRSRSAKNIVDEIEEILSLGYRRVWFADDCFTLNRERLLGICDEIVKRKLKVEWECLSRVDTINREIADRMKKAGCVRLFFGIESGNDKVLALIRKQINIEQAKQAVIMSKEAGIEVGAFFILGYPGETEETVLDSVNFASSLPLNYLSFTLPYPIPGTPLYERVKGELIVDCWEEPKNLRVIKHSLLFRSRFNEDQLKFAIAKGMIQFWMRKYLGNNGYKIIGVPFEKLTNVAFRLL